MIKLIFKTLTGIINLLKLMEEKEPKSKKKQSL